MGSHHEYKNKIMCLDLHKNSLLSCLPPTHHHRAIFTAEMKGLWNFIFTISRRRKLQQNPPLGWDLVNHVYNTA